MAQKVRIGYLAHDLGDPAIARRLRMLTLGGAEVRVAGFLRGTLPPDLPDLLILGQTTDARMGQRALAVARVLARNARAARAV